MNTNPSIDVLNALMSLVLWHDRDEAFLESVAERGNEIGSQAFEEELWEHARSVVSKVATHQGRNRE